MCLIVLATCTVHDLRIIITYKVQRHLLLTEERASANTFVSRARYFHIDRQLRFHPIGQQDVQVRCFVEGYHFAGERL